MKKIINAGLIISSLFGYLEWGESNSSFLFQTEYELLFGDIALKNFLHPFVILPLLGQVLLLITLFQKKPNKILSIVGLICLSILTYFICFVGVMATNLPIVLSTVPFLAVSFLFYQHRYALSKMKKNE